MVVTRFAPSPTGYLHVGGARTALFCWLFARRMGGEFMLRIEDTDQKRNTPTAADQVMSDLRWLGLEWDQGPGVEGPHGPYFQSERREFYDKYLKQLLSEQKAYYCFDTSEELEAMRGRAAVQKESFVYPRPDPYPTEADAAKARGEGRPVTVRFAVQRDKAIVVNDVVRGEVTFGAGEIGDFIICKSDGFPTYHFACVVDDELMEVTHVIRGQEHLMNTPGHIALQEALGFGTPVYAHMSVTVSDTGGKLSKRERPKSLRKAIKADENIDRDQLASVGGISGDELDSFINGKSSPDIPAVNAMAECLGVHLPEINVVDFFEGGYLPETMVNFLGLLGWSTSDDREIMTIDEQIECFDLSRFAKSNSLFDRKKLMAFNTEHIRMLDIDKLLGHFKEYVKVAGSPLVGGDDELLKKIITSCKGARTLAEIDKKARFLFIENEEIEYSEKAVGKVLLKNDGLAMLAVVRQRLAELGEVTAETIEGMLRSLAEEKQVGLGKVAQPLRVAICGDTISPPIFESIDMLGVENTLARIDVTLKKFDTN